MTLVARSVAWLFGKWSALLSQRILLAFRLNCWCIRKDKRLLWYLIICNFCTVLIYRYLYRAEFPLHGLLHLVTLIILYPPLLLICVVVACDHRSTSALVALLHGHRPYVLHCIMLLVFFQSTACVVMLTANHRSTSGDNMCVKTSCYIFRVPLAWANRNLDNTLRLFNLQLFREWECRHDIKTENYVLTVIVVGTQIAFYPMCAGWLQIYPCTHLQIYIKQSYIAVSSFCCVVLPCKVALHLGRATPSWLGHINV